MKVNRQVDGEKLLRGALIGCGQVANYHLNAWSSLDNIEIIALVNRTRSRALAYGEQFNIPPNHIYESLEDLFSNEQIDFVDIATAPSVHHQQVLASIEQGLSVLCQKPFAENLLQARAMIEAAEKKGVLLSVNENWRWRRWYREIKRIIISGEIGTPRYCCIKRHNNGTLLTNTGELPELLSTQPYTRDMEHLLLYEWGIHIIDVSRYLFGECLHLFAAISRVSEYFNGEDRAIVNMRFPDIDVVIDLSWATIEDDDAFSQLEHVVIEGEKGTITISPEDEPNIVVTTRTGRKIIPAMVGDPTFEYQKSYSDAIAHFIFCLRSGQLPETNARDNLNTLTCLFAAYASAKDHQVINMQEFLRGEKV